MPLDATWQLGGPTEIFYRLGDSWRSYCEEMSSDEFDKCITCKVEVKDEDQALQCEGWEHIHCIKMCDKPSQACYEALMQTPCKALLFTCSWCKGTLVPVDTCRDDARQCPSTERPLWTAPGWQESWSRASEVWERDAEVRAQVCRGLAGGIEESAREGTTWVVGAPYGRS